MLTAFLHLIGSWIQLIVFLYTLFSQFFMMSSLEYLELKILFGIYEIDFHLLLSGGRT